jgi:hypothetical protein
VKPGNREEIRIADAANGAKSFSQHRQTLAER